MCFKNLPVEFDAQGRASLRAGAVDPYKVVRNGRPDKEERIKELLRRNGHLKEVSIDPVTRVAGALAFHSVVDMENRRVEDAHSMATLFRGYEIILKGRDPRDAIFISSRACGVCGGVHANCSAEAIEMAFGVAPPPMGTIVRNLGQAAEFLYDHPLHLYLLAGPDYSEAVVGATNPEILARAQTYPARGRAHHGFSTIGEIMTALNPLTGSLYLQALHETRRAREMTVLVWGKYPHPQTIVPGGISATVTSQTLNEYQTRLFYFLDYAKRIIAVWDDVFDFLYEVEPRFHDVGKRPRNLIDLGIWEHHDAYDATYARAGEWGERRWATPGVILEGELITTDLHRINAGLEEFVDHSFYDEWAGKPVPFATDPLGTPLSPYHMWNKETLPKPQGRSWREKYSWATSPRWDRQVVEAGAYARMWTTAAARKYPENPFIWSKGTSLEMLLPAASLPEMRCEWRIPTELNAIERNRARAYAQAYTALVALNNLLAAYELQKTGETAVSRDYEIPKGERVGVGFWGAGRGYLSHHLTMDKGALTNYQICTPSTINASPVDPFGQPGPYEQAVMNTPIIEQFAKGGDFKGIDILRTIRSFDPCMPCTTHMYAGDVTVVREVNTCACALDDEDEAVPAGALG
ncbi:MAG TPA: nickel-dependent hydrogenase large subunit [Candidatus Limnocylindria bacterium]|nr:nickel-dependent hydrogenase large subunit [Candidatus Limnocylindria bacterium]